MFHFKQFSVADDQSTMKVGTDAVLLGVLSTPHYPPQRILEIGCGCGVISLILAQYNANSTIDSIDIDQLSVIQSAFNFSSSPWHSRINAIHTDIKDYSTDTLYDLIVSNPPFFQNSLKAPDKRRSLARHTDTLPFTLLVQSVSRLLAENGTFYCILPCPEAEDLIHIATSMGLFCNQKVFIHNKPDSLPVRIVFTLEHQKTTLFSEEHYHLRANDNSYSQWYRSITSELYLNL